MKTHSMIARALLTLPCCALLFLGACGGGETIALVFSELAAVCDQPEIGVNTADESLPGTGENHTCGAGEPCTLRAALNSAYLCRDHPEAGSVRTIRLQPETTYALSQLYTPSDLMKDPEAVQNARVGGVLLPRIFGNVVIEGEGSTIEVGVGLFGSRWARRFFHVAPGASLTLRNLTLRLGRLGVPSVTPREGHEGSAIFNEGRLVLDAVTFAENIDAYAVHNRQVAGTPPAEVMATRCVFERNVKGAISNASGRVVADDCRFLANIHRDTGAILITGGSFTTRNGTLFSDNISAAIGTSSCIDMHAGVLSLTQTTFDGNGVTPTGLLASVPVNIRGGFATVDQCTFHHNGGVNASALDLAAGTLTISRSTFFENRGAGVIRVRDDPAAAVVVEDVTIHANETNTPGVGIGGLRVDGVGRAELSNTVFSNNVPVNCGFAPGALPILRNTCMSTDASCPGATIIVDPMFVGGLRDNGGPTATLLPQGSTIVSAASPLVDAGSGATLSHDQRGMPRLVGSGVDVGAVERQASEAP